MIVILTKQTALHDSLLTSVESFGSLLSMIQRNEEYGQNILVGRALIGCLTISLYEMLAILTLLLLSATKKSKAMPILSQTFVD